jgi:hypothetical protein
MDASLSTTALCADVIARSARGEAIQSLPLAQWIASLARAQPTIHSIFTVNNIFAFMIRLKLKGIPLR